MPQITITPEVFYELAKGDPKILESALIIHYTRERLEKFDIDPIMLDCLHVTKQMVQALFSIYLPRSIRSMEAFLKKCSPDELLAALISKVETGHSCWDGDIVQRNDVVSKVLLQKSYYKLDILKAFIASDSVTLKDVQLLMGTQLHGVERSNVFKIINSAEGKYSVEDLLQAQTIDNVQEFKQWYGREDDFEAKLSCILTAKKAAAPTAPEHKVAHDDDHHVHYEAIATTTEVPATGVSVDHTHTDSHS